MDFNELRRQSQEQLVEFLRNELALAKTFVDLARTSLEMDDLPKYQRLLSKAGAAIVSIRNFEERVIDQAVRTQIQLKLEDLESVLFSQGKNERNP